MTTSVDFAQFVCTTSCKCGTSSLGGSLSKNTTRNCISRRNLVVNGTKVCQVSSTAGPIVRLFCLFWVCSHQDIKWCSDTIYIILSSKSCSFPPLSNFLTTADAKQSLHSTHITHCTTLLAFCSPDSKFRFPSLHFTNQSTSLIGLVFTYSSIMAYPSLH